ncbi:MAG: hypothetical protein AVDCRST_MAG85-1906 [uncultured Solirubrobacteraceae bacterium]|uniref:SCP domain-containing protein n=1 Tax=uncultured Solirubrobacteraceae bacterium TaxID=1162706 RepID=A0A6J4SRJ6_9ACTN|nr:MAG: hypothetical protein AVDCRST_MAG85-1906 [uncultured Solirubrobacteraceae bacterium]
MRTFATALVVLGLMASPAFGQEPDPDDPLLPPVGTCAHEDNAEAHHRLQRLSMHCLLDALRERGELRRLRSSVDLRHSATYKARRIADCKVFSHYPCGDRLASSFDQAGVTQRGRWLVGENLAYGVAEDSSPRRILIKWLTSKTHRAVLADERFTYSGIRRRRLKMKGAPTGSVIWVLHVGVPRGR